MKTMRKLRYISLGSFFISFFACIIYVEGWWLMAQMSALNAPSTYCSATPGLSRRQRALCYRYPHATRALQNGLRAAFDECRMQFSQERWNCTLNNAGGLSLKIASAEVAFLYAITAAGASHALARDCARGIVPDCGCGDNPLRVPPLASTNPHTVVEPATGSYITSSYLFDDRNFYRSDNNYDSSMTSLRAHNNVGSSEMLPYYSPTSSPPIDFTWAGCSHNVRYANAFGRRFVDSTEKQHMDARALMNLHNNRVGRRALASNLRRQCKCHGVSGSCVTKTCWSVVPTMDELGTVLKRKHERAQRVILISDSMELARAQTLTKTNEGTLARASDFSRPHRSSTTNSVAASAHRGDLVFLDSSPDYCERNDSQNVPGTAGRECVSSTSCAQLCCGRGWHIVREFREEPCRCHFIWCCEVKCDMCIREIERFFCN